MGLSEMASEVMLDLVKNEGALNKTAGVMGMLFPYAGLTKRALDVYISDVENSNMSSESKLLAILNAKKTIKQLKNQKKIAEIALDNVKTGTDFTSKSGVNEEWLERFMDSAGFVSSEDVQLIWGKILGNEFEKPGSTPPNMIRILSEITSTYAQAFKKICSMHVMLFPINDEEQIERAMCKIMVPYRGNDKFMEEIGLSFNILNELETLGLIKFTLMGDYASTKIPEKKVVVYVDGQSDTIIEHNKDTIMLGNVTLTVAGEALFAITPFEKIEGYAEMVKQYMLNNRVKYMDESKYQIVEKNNYFHIEKSDDNN
ncbi:MAG: DUF2806 domain-containing protein [Lachnospiraceae bacterium]|nr:DUF2806 domain-containing protein [Lachnospiraceae bacterium]